MSIVLRQIFQRGRGTAPLLRPRSPAPFETGIAVAAIDQPGLEQSYEIETAPFAPSVGPVSAPDTPMAIVVKPIEQGPSANPLREAAGAADQSGESQTRLMPPAALETLAPRGVAAISTAKPEGHPPGTETNPIEEQLSRPTSSASHTQDTPNGLAAAPNIATARSSPATGQVGAPPTAVAPPAQGTPPSDTIAAFGSTEREPALRPVDTANPVPVAAEVTTQSSTAVHRDSSRRDGDSKTKTAAVNSSFGERLQPAAPPAANPRQSAPKAPDATPVPPAIEIRIGRIDVTVPPAAIPAAPRSADVGMSLDAFIAETRQ